MINADAKALHLAAMGELYRNSRRSLLVSEDDVWHLMRGGWLAMEVGICDGLRTTRWTLTDAGRAILAATVTP